MNSQEYHRLADPSQKTALQLTQLQLDHPLNFASMLPTAPIPPQVTEAETTTISVTSPPAVAIATTNIIGSNPCSSSIETVSMKDLRLRGSSFLRSHASKHGIPNASRKLTSKVLEELRAHYIQVHRIQVVEDDYKESVVKQEIKSEVGLNHHVTSTSQKPGGKMKNKKSATVTNPVPYISASSTIQGQDQHQKSHHSIASLLPQYPLAPLQLHMPQGATLPRQQFRPNVPPGVLAGADTKGKTTVVAARDNPSMSVAPVAVSLPSEPEPRARLEQALLNNSETPTTMLPKDPLTLSSPPTTIQAWNTPCEAPILARNKAELTSFGTSLLRPEAAAHKVHNASRKPKDLVIEELWRHYMECHSAMVAAAAEPGWVGNVIDDDDDAK